MLEFAGRSRVCDFVRNRATFALVGFRSPPRPASCPLGLPSLAGLKADFASGSAGYTVAPTARDDRGTDGSLSQNSWLGSRSRRTLRTDGLRLESSYRLAWALRRTRRLVTGCWSAR